jgi:hypothetical protein
MQTKLITVGGEYAVLESPTARRKPPARKVEVLALRSKAEAGGYGRLVQVRFVTAHSLADGGYYYGLDSAKEGDTRWIAPRQVVGKWDETYEKAFADAEADQQARRAAIKRVEDRLEAFGINAGVSAFSFPPYVTSVTLRGDDLERILRYAEAGARSGYSL